ncbi:hypothetical protein [Paraburkholderia sediminicola]|uniref:hypothetical protein n=1 Tax=Paraburkholderia sediminicola TaxID=458836 RepID=UPI0038BAFE52
MAALSQSCRATLYRALCERPGTASAVFFHASTREEAWKNLHVAMARLLNRQAGDTVLCRMDSYEELVDAGISQDHDLRLFEIAWQGVTVTAWVTRPVFLSRDPLLQTKSRELAAQLTLNRSRSVKCVRQRSKAMPPH